MGSQAIRPLINSFICPDHNKQTWEGRNIFTMAKIPAIITTSINFGSYVTQSRGKVSAHKWQYSFWHLSAWGMPKADHHLYNYAQYWYEWAQANCTVRPEAAKAYTGVLNQHMVSALMERIDQYNDNDNGVIYVKEKVLEVDGTLLHRRLTGIRHSPKPKGEELYDLRMEIYAALSSVNLFKCTQNPRIARAFWDWALAQVPCTEVCSPIGRTSRLLGDWEVVTTYANNTVRIKNLRVEGWSLKITRHRSCIQMEEQKPALQKARELFYEVGYLWLEQSARAMKGHPMAKRKQ